MVWPTIPVSFPTPVPVDHVPSIYTPVVEDTLRVYRGSKLTVNSLDPLSVVVPDHRIWVIQTLFLQMTMVAGIPTMQNWLVSVEDGPFTGLQVNKVWEERTQAYMGIYLTLSANFYPGASAAESTNTYNQGYRNSTRSIPPVLRSGQSLNMILEGANENEAFIARMVYSESYID